MKKPRHLSPDEKALWDTVAHQTTPLDPKPVERIQTPNIKSKKSTKIRSFQIGEKALDDRGSAITAAQSKPSLNMDAGSFAKLKRGKIAPERRIDLHGLTLSQAHPELTRFILEAYRDQKRLVLVITGKGERSDPKGPYQVQRGVLRRQVPLWLGMPPLKNVILQVAPSHQRHGGDGALYVYLRRQR